MTLPAVSIRPRDARLDFWRGLCLIDMVVVHLCVWGLPLSRTPFMLVAEYLRFAAGGFVFMSGVAIGMIYLPKVKDDARRSAAYRTLFKRAFFILGVHFAATIYFLLYYPLAGYGPYDDAWHQVRAVLLLQSGSDLLPFYATMLVVCPLVLELLRRGLWPLVVLISAGLFFWAQSDPFRFALPMGDASFIAPLWQVIFVGGLLFGAFKSTYERSNKVLLFVVAFVTCVWMTLSAYGPDFGLPSLSPFTFAKRPLTAGEALRYVSFTLTIVIGTDLLWRHISNARVVGAVARLGRRSLSMYVLHVWIVHLILAGFLRLGIVNDLTSAGVLVVSVLTLWASAWVLDRVDAMKHHAFRLRVPSVPGFARLPLATCLAAGLLLFVNAHVPAPVTTSATADEWVEPEQPGPEPFDIIDTPAIMPA